MDDLVERLGGAASGLDYIAMLIENGSIDQGSERQSSAVAQAAENVRDALARIQALETSLAEAEGRVKAITIALHDAIRRPMGQVPESADPFYSPAMAEQAEARRVARSQALSELVALGTGDSPSPPPVV